MADTSAESADTVSCVESPRYKQNNHSVRRSFMFHYRVLGCLGAVFAALCVAICCKLLQTPYAQIEPSQYQLVFRRASRTCSGARQNIRYRIFRFSVPK